MNFFSKTVVILSVTSLSLLADMWRLESGAGLWSAGASGTSTGTYSTSIGGQLIATDHHGDYTSMENGYFYLSIKHPLPVLPNVRLEYANVKSSGKVDGELKLPPLGTITAVEGENSYLGLTQIDTILFYNLLDKTFWGSVDLGLDLKYVASEYTVDSLYVDERSDSITPLLYLRGRVDVPFAPIGLETDIKYITDGASTVYDIRAKVDYTFKLTPVIRPGVELGYRVQRFKIDGEESSIIGTVLSEESDTDVTFAGVYGGVTVKF